MSEMKPSPFNGSTSTPTPPPPFNGDTSTPPPPPFSGDTSTPPPPPFNGDTSTPPPPSLFDSNANQAPPPAAEAVRPGDHVQQTEQQPLFGKYITSRKPDFVCPFCMREICKADLLYYCERCKNVYTEKEAKARLSRVVKKQYYCCNNSITSNIICPNCRVEAENGGKTSVVPRFLPSEVYNVKNEFRVCMAGYSSSGKTQYITQLMDYIAKRSLPGIDSTYFLDNATQEIREAIRHKFFADRAINATASGYLEPLLFNIHKGRHDYVSVFYDIAGEDFRENRKTLATKCIWNSKNILLIIDPTTLPGLKDHPEVKKHENEGKASKGEVMEPLNTYMNFVRNNHPDKEKFLKKVNLAIVFPKMDMFYDDEYFPEILKRESSHIAKGKFDMEEVDSVSKAMESWLREKEGDALLSALNGYPNARIFGVSSGSLEEKGVEPKKPNRLLDPYLWLLFRNDIFK